LSLQSGRYNIQMIRSMLHVRVELRLITDIDSIFVKKIIFIFQIYQF